MWTTFCIHSKNGDKKLSYHLNRASAMHFFVAKLLSIVILTGMWSRSRRLGLETVSRRTNVSSRSRLGQSVQCLGLVSVSDLCVSGLVSVSAQKVSASRLGSRTFSSRRFIQARHAKLQFSDTSQYALVRSSWLILSNNVDCDS